MKKKLFLLLTVPTIILLSSCTFSLTDDPEDIPVYIPSTSSSSSLQNIEYFDGNDFEDDIYNHKVTIHCTNV